MDFTTVLNEANLTNDVLSNLGDNFTKIQELIDSHETIINLKTAKEDLLTKTKELAQNNINKKPELEQKQQQLYELNQKFESLKSDYLKMEEQIKSNSNELTLDNAKMKLESAQIDANSQCENLTQQFEDEEIKLPKYIRLYIEQKTKSHMRKIKIEEINKIINTPVNSSRPINNVQNNQMPMQYPQLYNNFNQGYRRPVPPIPGQNTAYTPYGNYPH